MRSSQPETAVVNITLVNELPVKNKIGAIPMRRFDIQAAKVDDDPEGGSWNKHLSFTTLDQWKASLCHQAQQAGLPLKVTYRNTGYWDADLLSVERP